MSHDSLQDHTHMIILTQYQNHDPWHQKCCKTHLRSQSLHLPIRGSENFLSTSSRRAHGVVFFGFQHLKDPNGEVSQKLEDKKWKTTFWDHKMIGNICWYPVLNYESGNLGRFGFWGLIMSRPFLVGNNH